MLDDQPLSIGPGQRGTVLFQPVDGGAVGTGLIDQHGKYRVSAAGDIGLPPGKYAVTVRAVEVIPATEATDEPTGRPLTPAVYASANTSGFTFEITPGGNSCDLALRSDAGPTVVPEPVEARTEPEEGRESSREKSPNGETELSGQVSKQE